MCESDLNLSKIISPLADSALNWMNECQNEERKCWPLTSAVLTALWLFDGDLTTLCGLIQKPSGSSSTWKLPSSLSGSSCCLSANPGPLSWTGDTGIKSITDCLLSANIRSFFSRFSFNSCSSTVRFALDTYISWFWLSQTTRIRRVYSTLSLSRQLSFHGFVWQLRHLGMNCRCQCVTSDLSEDSLQGIPEFFAGARYLCWDISRRSLLPSHLISGPKNLYRKFFVWPEIQ